MRRCPTCDATLESMGRFCPGCGAPLDSSAVAEARTILAGPTPESVVRGATGIASPGSMSTSFDPTQFTPGIILAERYRIVALIGRGGMGEVYRADDLKLGQTVALKFLPRDLAESPDRLARFYNEVRIARTVSHPNVCRVYDVGELEGLPYLSMEFVDGDDLSVLLRRVGRLPKEKALEVARQLCAGLAAAHDKGVLHRDLKPANVLIDGQGKVRITDFGLAVLAGEERRVEGRAGTPAYMAPEQLTRNEVSVQSDVYSLGIVLYEMFTGHTAFSAKTLAEMTRMQQESTPPSITSLVQDLDQTIERPILRCLEKNPNDRPTSALQVARSLPGGDPLAEALAAGEIPSPDMVAAAGGEGGVRPRVAWGLLAVFAGCLVVLAGFAQRELLFNRIPLEKPPAVLMERAREILRLTGYSLQMEDWSRGFFVSSEYLDWVRDHDQRPDRWKALESGQPFALGYWYRQAPGYMQPRSLMDGYGVSIQDPPPTRAGMASVFLDASGRLVGLRVVPPQRDSLPVEGTTDWGQVFALAGLDFASFTPTPPQWNPPVFSQERFAWSGTFPDHADIPLRVEAGTYSGRLNHLQLVAPWTQEDRMQPRVQRWAERVGQTLASVLLLALLLGSILLARRNLISGHGDRRGALRIATLTFAINTLVWALIANHAPSFQQEWELLFPVLGLHVFFSMLLWALYIALEPYVRQRWPDSLIGWSRLLSGRLRDPRVGRDVFIGCVAACVLNVVLGVFWQTPEWLGMPPLPPSRSWATGLLGPLYSAIGIVDRAPNAIVNGMAFLLLLSVLRRLLRRDGLALIVFLAIFSVIISGEIPIWWIGIPFGLFMTATWVFVLRRFGLLAMIATLTTQTTLDLCATTTDMSRWYAVSGLVGPVVVILMTLYGFRVATTGRPLFKFRLLAD